MFDTNMRTLKAHVRKNNLEFVSIGHSLSMDEEQLAALKESLVTCYALSKEANTTTSKVQSHMRVQVSKSGKLPAKPKRVKPQMYAE